MLGIFGSKSDHPLASVKSAQHLLDNIPKTDSVAVIDEIGQWIEELFKADNEFRLEHQFTILRMLDDAAHPHLRKVNQSYYTVEPLTTFHDNRLWGALNAYYTFIELGYLNLVLAMRHGAKGGSSLKQHVALICIRGIYAIWGRLECAAVKYAQLDPQLWIHLADFYDHAEVEQCLDDETQIYGGATANSTVESLFAALVSWYSIGVGGLKPLDLHIAKGLILSMRRSFFSYPQVQEDSLFIFDLANPLEPSRVKEAGAMYPLSTRFVSMRIPVAHMDDLLRTLNKNIVPEYLNFGIPYGAEMVAEVATRIESFSKTPLPSRRHQRRKVKMNIKVLSGFSNVIAQSESNVFFEPPPSEHWEVQDISATGLSCVLPAESAYAVKIGSLLGIMPDKAQHLGVGMVRRLRRDQQNNLHIGVRILSNKVEGVLLESKEGDFDDFKQLALLMDRSGDQSGESWLLMKTDTFSITKSPTMRLGREEFLMLPVGVVEKGADFDWVAYRKMINEDSGDAAY